MTDKILHLREAGNVLRFHPLPYLGAGNTVGKHSFDMLVLLDRLHPDPPLRLYRAVLYHDLHERWTGDVPAPIRHNFPDLKRAHNDAVADLQKRMKIPAVDLTDDERRWLKALDVLEVWLWYQDQLAFGNRHVERAERDAKYWLDWCDVREVRVFVREFRWERTLEIFKS